MSQRWKSDGQLRCDILAKWNPGDLFRHHLKDQYVDGCAELPHLQSEPVLRIGNAKKTRPANAQTELTQGILMLTTKQAAQRLQVSVGRVVQLIAAGRLRAEKFGEAWAVDEKSVARFSPLPPGWKPGRKRNGSIR